MSKSNSLIGLGAALVFYLGGTAYAGEAPTGPETPIIEQKKDHYKEFVHLYGEFIKHDKSLLPTLEEKLKEIKSKLRKNPPTDLSDKLFFLKGVERDLNAYKTQFSIYEETHKTLEEMLDKISEGKSIPGLYSRLSFIKRTKVNKLTSPYLLATKGDLLSLIDEIYHAEADRKKGLSKRTKNTVREKPPLPKIENLQKRTKSSKRPILHMNFDKGTIINYRGRWMVKDLSGKGNHGIIHGDPKFVEGIKGEAIEFDGVDDYIDLENNRRLKTSFPITISVYVNLPQPIESSNTIIQSDDSGSYHGYWLAILKRGIIHTSYGDGKGSGGPKYRRSIDGSSILQPDTWNHIVGVISGATDMAIYVNGENDGGRYSGNGGTISYSSYNFKIGSSKLVGHLNGSLDEIMIFDRALSGEEIEQLYLSTKE